VPLCPIDRDTHLVLTAYELLIANGGGGPRVEELDGRADDGTLSPQDRTKLRVLMSIAAIRSGRRRATARHLETLTHDAVFGAWAERELGQFA
jgi:hypothetical protein